LSRRLLRSIIPKIVENPFGAQNATPENAVQNQSGREKKVPAPRNAEAGTGKFGTP
jgi:hypothetical protein